MKYVAYTVATLVWFGVYYWLVKLTAPFQLNIAAMVMIVALLVIGGIYAIIDNYFATPKRGATYIR